MALPVAPPPKSNDVAVLGWAGITVRIAWTLRALGVKVRPEVLRDARNHVLYHLDAAVPMPHAEDLALRWVEGYVARARGELPVDPWPADWEAPLSPRWREALAGSDPTVEAVLRKHYADGRSLSRLESQLPGVDRAALEAIQHGLREAIRKIRVTDGLPLEGWDNARVDRLLKRIAAYAPWPCPPPLNVAEGCHREHILACPRCDRLLRLVQNQVIAVDDLYPPTVGARPSGRARVLALQLHPDARRVRRSLNAELPVPAFPAGEDIVLLDGAAMEAIAPILRVAAEVGLPPREHLRGALIEGVGSWSAHGLLGPLPERAIREVHERSWGVVDGVGSLPEVLPEPPSAKRWWIGAAGMCAVAGAMVTLAMVAPGPVPGSTLEVGFSPGRGGTWVAFDVPESSVVTVVAERDGELVPVLASSTAADKALYAMGDGTYRVHVAADAVLIASADGPIPRLDRRLRDADASEEPIEALAEQLTSEASVAWYRR